MAAAKEWAAIRLAVLERDGYRCQICKRAKATTVDHIWPASQGGSNAAENLRAACKPCNSRKRARVPDGMLPLFVSPERLWLCDYVSDSDLKDASRNARRQLVDEQWAREQAARDQREALAVAWTAKRAS